MSVLNQLNNRENCEVILAHVKKHLYVYKRLYPELENPDISNKLRSLLVSYYYVAFCSKYHSKESHKKINDLLLSYNKGQSRVIVNITEETDELVLAFKYLYMLVVYFVCINMSVEHRIINKIDYNRYMEHIDLFNTINAIDNNEYLNEAYTAAKYL